MVDTVKHLSISRARAANIVRGTQVQSYTDATAARDIDGRGNCESQRLEAAWICMMALYMMEIFVLIYD